MKLLKTIAVATMLGMMLTGCESPVEEAKESAYVQAEETVSIKLVRISYIDVMVREGNKITAHYYLADNNIFDTVSIDVPKRDTINLMTYNANGYKDNFVPVVADSLYALKAR